MATVVLTAPTTSTYQIRLVADTDAAGKFQFTGLPPGIYRLSASRAGFLDHPARRVISLGSDDHATDAEIRLPPQGAIAGRILDEEDDPSPGAFVWIFKQVYRNGRKQWDRLNISSVANDAGEYRIPNLKPGTYLLQTRSQRPQADNRYGGRDMPDTPRMFYVPVYYRNASTQQAALPVEVGVGAEVRARNEIKCAEAQRRLGCSV